MTVWQFALQTPHGPLNDVAVGHCFVHWVLTSLRLSGGWFRKWLNVYRWVQLECEAEEHHWCDWVDLNTKNIGFTKDNSTYSLHRKAGRTSVAACSSPHLRFRHALEFKRSMQVHPPHSHLCLRLVRLKKKKGVSSRITPISTINHVINPVKTNGADVSWLLSLSYHICAMCIGLLFTHTHVH